MAPPPTDTSRVKSSAARRARSSGDIPASDTGHQFLQSEIDHLRVTNRLKEAGNEKDREILRLQAELERLQAKKSRRTPVTVLSDSSESPPPQKKKTKKAKSSKRRSPSTESESRRPRKTDRRSHRSPTASPVRARGRFRDDSSWQAGSEWRESFVQRQHLGPIHERLPPFGSAFAGLPPPRPGTYGPGVLSKRW